MKVTETHFTQISISVLYQKRACLHLLGVNQVGLLGINQVRLLGLKQSWVTA